MNLILTVISCLKNALPLRQAFFFALAGFWSKALFFKKIHTGGTMTQCLRQAIKRARHEAKFSKALKALDHCYYYFWTKKEYRVLENIRHNQWLEKELWKKLNLDKYQKYYKKKTILDIDSKIFMKLIKTHWRKVFTWFSSHLIIFEYSWDIKW